MFLRILLISVALPAFTLSCSLFPKSNSGQGIPKKATGNSPIQNRPSSVWFLNGNDISQPFAYFHCGKEIFPLLNFKRGQGTQQTDPNWFWTIKDQAEITFYPPHPVLKKDLELRIPNPILNIRNRQTKIQADFLINGKPLSRQVFHNRAPASIRLKIPARLNQSNRMTLTIRFIGILRQSELTGNRDTRKLGIGFRFINDDLVLSNRKISRAVFLVEKISPPDRNGIQKASLRILDQIYGPALPKTLAVDLYPAAIDPRDPIRQYLAGDRLELILLNRPGRPYLVLYGGAVSWTPDPSCQAIEMRGDIKNPFLPESVVQAQKELIAKALLFTRTQLKNRTRDPAAEERFQRIWIRRQKELQRIPAVFSLDNGQEIERLQNQFFRGISRGSFFTLPKKFVFMERQKVSHNISALLALRNRLRDNGIQLIILLVPEAEQIAARALIPQFESRGSLSAIQCAATLLEFGLEAIYTDDAVLAKIPASQRLFCYPDPRPEAALWKILAEITAKRLSRFGQGHFTESEDVHFFERRGPTAFGKNYRWPDGADFAGHKNGEIVESVQVFRNGVPFRPDPQSAILAIGGEILNLPGPGHTFSGLLSKTLRYSVDELILPGEGWIHNLPGVLSRQSRRFLAGKQAVVLVISPRTLAENTLPDLKGLEAEERMLKKQKAVHHFPLNGPNDNIRPPAVIPGERNYAEKAAYNTSWSFALVRTPAVHVRIKETGQPQNFLSLDLPRNLISRPMTLVLNLAPYPGQTNTLTVNGQAVPLPVNTMRSHFLRIAVPLKPGTAKAVLKFSGRRDNLIMVRDITLYQ